MNNKPKILELLNRKRSLFLKIEDMTEKMKYVPLEELNDIFESRGEVLSLIEEIDGEIKTLSGDDKTLQSLLNSSASPEGLLGEESDIFKASLSVKAVANRVLKSEPEVMRRIESEKQELLNRLEEINTSSQSVAGSYMRSVQTGFPQTNLSSGEKSI